MDNSEQRFCKNMKCSKILPADYKYKYCEACRNVRAQKTKNIIGAITVTATASATMIFAGKNIRKS